MAGNPYLWSTTALSNESSDADINWAEGQTPGSVNGSARAMMAGIAGWLKDTNCTLTTGGSANAQTLTSNVGYAALANGLRLEFKAGFTNTGTMTLTVTPAGGSAFAATGITYIKAGANTNAYPGMIQAGGHYIVEYDSGTGSFICLNPTSDKADAATISSASTTELGSTLAQSITISGTVTITSFGNTASTGTVKFIEFSGALTLTHNGTSLILPTGADILTIAGDCATFRHEGSGNWRCLHYTSPGAYASFTPTVTSGTGTLTTATAAGYWKRIGKTVFLAVRATITNNGTGGGDIRITTPVNNRVGTPGQVIAGKEIGTTNKTCSGSVQSNLIICTFYDGTYPGGAGSNIIEIAGSYEAA